MNILFIVPYTPTLIRTRPYNLIRELVSRGHDLTLATLWTDEAERHELLELSKGVKRLEAARMPRWRSYWNSLLALPQGIPLQAAYSWQPALAKRLQQLSGGDGKQNPFDIIHVEHLRGARYGIWLKSIQSRTPVVWDSVDCISLLFQQASVLSRKRVSRWITMFELGRTRRYEGWLSGQFDQVLVTSPKDQEALADLARSSQVSTKIKVVPNGVDLNFFKPDPAQKREPETLVVSGKMSYHANVTMVLDLVRNIMPIIWAARPEVKLWIVGKDPATEIKALVKDQRIIVTGTVADIRPYLQSATVAAAPIAYGAGIQNKVLEAMACAAPVVATPQAVSALNVKSGDEILVARDYQEFAIMVLRLLSDPAYQRQIGQSGARYVETTHRWANIAGQLEGIYNETINNRSQSLE